MPRVDGMWAYEGDFHFRASVSGSPDIEDHFQLLIVIPEAKSVLPIVQEVGNRILRKADNHVNGDGTLCLGSELRLLQLIGRGQRFSDFIRLCLIPYLVGTRQREDGTGSYLNGELPHNDAGLIEEYQQMLSVKGEHAIKVALHLASKRRRVANKKPCPCNCGRRLGRCQVRLALNGLRLRVSRSALREMSAKLFQG